MIVPPIDFIMSYDSFPSLEGPFILVQNQADSLIPSLQ